jgi:stress response protein YsnF
VRVEKQPVVTGEVVIGKQQVQDTEQYTDTVRREEAHIEHEGDVDIRGSDAGSTEQYPNERPE